MSSLDEWKNERLDERVNEYKAMQKQITGISKIDFTELAAGLQAPPHAPGPMGQVPSWQSSHQAMTRRGPSLNEMIAMRMGWLNADYKPGFAFMEAFRINADRVVVFIVNNEQECTLEDDGHLFPSDKLITQLRMILG